MKPSASSSPAARILLCSALILTLSMGVRHGFGLWLQPITQAQNWTRETFSFAMAIQNLAWGFFGIFAGMLADRFGAQRVLIAGGLVYAAGLAGMALAPNPLLFALSAGVLIGAAQAATTYSIIYGVIGRQIDPAKRSWAMGITATAGSFGQFLMVPLESSLISGIGWQQSLLVLGAMVLLIMPIAYGLREPTFAGGAAPRREQTILHAVAEAFKYPSFQLLMAGYFVCGFQLAFVAIHMPSYVKDKGLSPEVAGYALAVIGLFNVVGTFTAGVLGQRLARRKILAGIYLGRSAAIALFLMAPLTPLSVYVFSAAMGLFWLSTVPPTNATLAQIFGVAHFSMLGGFVFFSHQIGSFMGVWLGGLLYDRTGSYDIVWYISIALGIFAAIVNLPVREAPIARPVAQSA